MPKSETGVSVTSSMSTAARRLKAVLRLLCDELTVKKASKVTVKSFVTRDEFVGKGKTLHDASLL